MGGRVDGIAAMTEISGSDRRFSYFFSFHVALSRNGPKTSFISGRPPPRSLSII